jgi:hypothetical protein
VVSRNKVLVAEYHLRNLLPATTTAVTALAATSVAMAAARLRFHIFSAIATVVAMLIALVRVITPRLPRINGFRSCTPALRPFIVSHASAPCSAAKVP